MEPLRPDDPRTIGDYRLLRRIGSGGMGRVYLGRSARGRTVAVKIVHPHIAEDAPFRARFTREVAAARRVGGDWTAPVLDADPDADVPWVATGYVAGPDLQRAVTDGGPLPTSTARALAAGLAEALATVHGLGLVHRDVKPSNVMLTLDGPRLIDFGIARASDAGGTLTETGVYVGSPGYMAPEQLLHGDTGPASDVFALGSVLVLATTGQTPFPGDTPAHVLYRIAYEPPELDHVPDELRPVVERCLAKTAADRPEPAALAADLSGGAGAVALLTRGDGWLPPPVVAGVSRRAVELLDLEAESAGLPLPSRAAGGVPGARTDAGPDAGAGAGPEATGAGGGTTGTGTGAGAGAEGDRPRSASAPLAAAAGAGPAEPRRPEDPRLARSDTAAPAAAVPLAEAPPPAAAPPGGFGPPVPRSGPRPATPSSPYGAAGPDPRLLPTAGPYPVAGPATEGATTGAAAPGTDRKRQRQRQRRGPLLAVLGVVLALGAGVGGHLLLREDAGNTGDTDTAGPGPDGDEAADPADGHDGTVRERHAGVWEGETTFMGGLPAGTITITLEPGAPGDEVGVLVHTPLLPISNCVDRLTLDRVTETEIVLDAEVVPEESTAGACEEEPFQIFLGTGEEDVLLFSTDIRSGAEGPLARKG